MTLLILIALSPLSSEAYRRESCNVEIWFQFPAVYLLQAETGSSDTSYRPYAYRFVIRNREGSDSAVVAGVKSSAMGTTNRTSGSVTDFLPVTTYPGDFNYQLIIRVGGDTLVAEGVLSIPPDTAVLSLSDLMLGIKNFSEKFSNQGLEFVPRVVPEYSRFDTLLAELEIYGLTPDSQYFVNTVRIVDERGKVPIRKVLKRLKREPVQAETVSIGLLDIGPGRYRLEWTISDPANRKHAAAFREFEIKTGSLDKKLMVYYHEIQYLIPSNEYKRFLKMDEPRQESYLSEFWSHRDYWEFARRVEAADKDFATRARRGRDSERGKFYIKNGSPDDIERVALSEWARPFELWHYTAAGYDALFCDTKEDDNPVLIRILKPGEMTTILEMGLRKGDEGDWLNEIAPGTIPEKHKNVDE
jgi:GWxTD domain-containing protein